MDYGNYYYYLASKPMRKQCMKTLQYNTIPSRNIASCPLKQVCKVMTVCCIPLATVLIQVGKVSSDEKCPALLVNPELVKQNRMF